MTFGFSIRFSFGIFVSQKGHHHQRFINILRLLKLSCGIHFKYKKRDDTKIYVIFQRHKGYKRNGRQKDVFLVNRKKVSHASEVKKGRG